MLLRDLVTLRLKAVEQELQSLREAIERMMNKPANVQELDLIKFQLASLSEAIHDLELRVESLERHSSIATWFFRQAVTALVVVAIIYLLGVVR